MTEHAADVTQFPRAIGRPAAGALVNAGITSYEQLAGLGRRALLDLHGVGPKAVRILGDELAQRGLVFADEADPR